MVNSDTGPTFGDSFDPHVTDEVDEWLRANDVTCPSCGSGPNSIVHMGVNVIGPVYLADKAASDTNPVNVASALTFCGQCNHVMEFMARVQKDSSSQS